jgi:hypothetical protein
MERWLIYSALTTYIIYLVEWLMHINMFTFGSAYTKLYWIGWHKMDASETAFLHSVFYLLGAIFSLIVAYG